MKPALPEVDATRMTMDAKSKMTEDDAFYLPAATPQQSMQAPTAIQQP